MAAGHVTFWVGGRGGRETVVKLRLNHLFLPPAHVNQQMLIMPRNEKETLETAFCKRCTSISSMEMF